MTVSTVINIVVSDAVVVGVGDTVRVTGWKAAVAIHFWITLNYECNEVMRGSILAVLFCCFVVARK